jgi:tRNA threonylcarbamoyl adenosine modification protein YjeE
MQLQVLDLADEAATTRLAEDLAVVLKPGDVIALQGDLGAGKTTLARAIIRALADDPDLEVPSPTFTLAQDYRLARFPVFHFDLYRIGSPRDLIEIGFDDAIRSGAVLVEWPERAGDELPADALTLAMSQGAHADTRRVVLVGDPSRWERRLSRSVAIRAFLDDAGWSNAARRHLNGDASSRRYERINLGGQTAVLMDHPVEANDLAGQARKAARAAAKLAENTRPFQAFALALGERGFSTPTVFAHDPAAGFMLLEDLGADTCVAGQPPAPIPERYATAIELLAALHAMRLPDTIPDGCGSNYRLPAYGLDNLVAEVSVALEWGFPLMLGRPVDGEERASFLALWRPLFAEILAGPVTWCLRDYHSPNLMWLGDRQGICRIGLLDFQDTILGHPAYDVVSLAEDARVTVAPDLETALIDRYVTARAAAEPGFDAPGFRRAYWILSLQRNTRLLGTFARLLLRDGKPHYMKHYPRIWDYLDRAFQQDVSRPLKLWYDAHVPRAFPDRMDTSDRYGIAPD